MTLTRPTFSVEPVLEVDMRGTIYVEQVVI